MRNSIFGLNPSSEFSISPSDIWHMNRFKYNVIQLVATPSSDDALYEIYVCHPNTPMGSDKCPSQDAKIIAIQMKPGQVVVLPFHWYYMLPPSANESPYACLNCVGVHDYVTYMLP
jgi:hypothetical protein